MAFETVPDPADALVRAARRAGVSDARVLDAVRRVDRRRFVPPGALREAHRDAPVSIGSGQTTSQPSLIALMVEALELHGEERVLEVGGGYGYQTAVLAELAGEVYSIERHAELAEAARSNLEAHGTRGVQVVVGDGTRGLPVAAPFHAIVVSAASPKMRPAWGEQLVDGGRLVVPLGGRAFQEVVLFRRREGVLERERTLTPVRFVPLVPDE